MTGSSKRKGDKAELEVQGMLRDHLGLNVRRALGAGRSDDMGDIDGVPDVVIQVANWADLNRAVREKMPALEQQMLNARASHGALFCRRRGGSWLVAMTPEIWFALIREALDLKPVDDIVIPDQLEIQVP